MRDRPECVLDAKAAVGECPVWSPAEQVLYWIDVAGPKLHRFNPTTGVNETYALPDAIGSFALLGDGRFLVAVGTGLFRFDPKSGSLTPIAAAPEPLSTYRFNDGRTDSRGRFWVGTMAREPKVGQTTGSFYRLDPQGGLTRMLSGFIITNGLAFSPDSKRLYCTDSHVSVQTIWIYDYDLETGAVRNKRVFASTYDMPGRPDGAAMDAEGCYWSALNDGWHVGRFRPDGRIDRFVRLPVAKPSMCAFGGAKLDVLYVTSIRPKDQPETLVRQPLAGSIFAIDVGVSGIPEPNFAG
jgi:L-arabinonolactonase